MSRPSTTTARVDGRRLRAERSRDAVVDALLALFDEGHTRPGAALVAERAGVSQSTVFRAFDDLDALVEVAVEHQWARVSDRFAAPDAGGDLPGRIRTLVRQRLALHDAVGAVVRSAALLAGDSPALASIFAARRDLLRRQVEHHFAAELDRVDDRAERRALLDALDAASSIEHLEYLRHDRGAGVDRTAAALTLALTSLLSTVPPPADDPTVPPPAEDQEEPR